eukprot:1106882-Rhodomonas_salina.1
MHSQHLALLPWVSHPNHHVRVLASLALRHYHAEIHGRERMGSALEGEGSLMLEAAMTMMDRNDDVKKLQTHLHKLSQTLGSAFFSGRGRGVGFSCSPSAGRCVVSGPCSLIRTSMSLLRTQCAVALSTHTRNSMAPAVRSLLIRGVLPGAAGSLRGSTWTR